MKEFSVCILIIYCEILIEEILASWLLVVIALKNKDNVNFISLHRLISLVECQTYCEVSSCFRTQS